MDHLQFLLGAYDATAEKDVAESILLQVPELESKAKMKLSMGRAVESHDSEGKTAAAAAAQADE
eukprot:2682789-Pyramimonas_sp.AAC.1